MKRRRFLRAAGVAGLISAAGCLERLGFEEESAWRDPPMVEGRPDAVYVPASLEGMGIYGTSSGDEYAVTLAYTFPHRFWTITGTETNRVVVESDDSLHLMVTPWDPQTGTVLPVDLSMEIADGEEVVDALSPWRMLSQRMGFHYGDNVRLPGEGSYTASVDVGPVQTDLTGGFDGRFESALTLEVDFDFDRGEVHDLPFESVDQDRRGSRDAMELMNHAGGEDSDGDSTDGNHSDSGTEHPPAAVGRAVDELPGTIVGRGRSGDARFHALETTVDRLTGGSDAYLCVFVRTPYNDVVLPFTTISIRVDRNGGESSEYYLTETLDDEFGHHYGRRIESLEPGDEITITVDTPPQIARHDGYETAFLEFDPIRIER